MFGALRMFRALGFRLHFSGLGALRAESGLGKARRSRNVKGSRRPNMVPPLRGGWGGFRV